MNSAINPAIDINDKIDGRKWFHENIRDKDQLVITVGDSWTWGNSLGKIDADAGIIDDYEHRVASIYGCHIANWLDSDFVNIGIPGSDNVSIINRACSFINGITKTYKKIYLIITLTENGRELILPGFLECKTEYNQLKGTDWPEFADILANTANIDIVLTELADGRYGLDLVNKLKLFYALNQSKDLTDFFKRYDTYIGSFIYEKLNKLDDRFLCIIGRNFTSFAIKDHVNIPNIVWIDNIWTDVIATNGSLDQYPTVYAGSYCMSINPIIQFIDKLGMHVPTSEVMLLLINPGEEIIAWCDKSPYNSKTASRHPNEQGHIWWAEHLYNCIITHQELSGLAT